MTVTSLDWQVDCFITYIIIFNFYRPQTKLQKGKVFTPASQSFCSQGGVSRHALGQTPSPEQTPPWASTPPTLLGRHPLCIVHAGIAPAGDHCCGRYASYWNAFFFYRFHRTCFIRELPGRVHCWWKILQDASRFNRMPFRYQHDSNWSISEGQ